MSDENDDLDEVPVKTYWRASDIPLEDYIRDRRHIAETPTIGRC